MANGVAIGPQPNPHAAQQSQPGGQPQQQAPRPQPQPQSEGDAMLDRIAAIHADVDSLAAKVHN